MKNLFVFISIVFTTVLVAQNNSDSLEYKINESNDWNEKASLAYEFAKLNLTSNPDKCLDIYNTIQRNKHQVKDSTQLFNLFNIKGIIYQFRHEIDSSNQNLREALKIAENLKDSTSMMKALGNMGINYTEIGKYQKSIEVALKTLAYYKKKNDSGLIASAYSGITNNYAYMHNYSEALVNAKKSLFYFNAVNQKFGVANLNSTIGNIFENQDLLDSAVIYTEKAIQQYEELGSIYGVVNAKRNLCAIYKKLNKSNQEMLDCNLELLELDLMVKDKQGIMLDNLNIGASLYNLGKLKESLPYTSRALELSSELSDKRVRLECFESLALTFYELGEFEKAYEFADSTRKIEKKLLKKDIQEAIIDADRKFQVAEKEKELLKVNSEKLQAELKTAEKSKQLIFLSVVFVLLLIVGVFLLYRAKQKARQEKDAIRIEEQQKGIKAIIQTQESERKRIAKELHDGIVQQLVGLKLSLINYFEGKETENSKKILQILSNSSEELREISHKMMPRTLAENGLVPAIEDMLRNSIGNTSIQYKFEHNVPSKRLSENIELAIYRITQELITNVIKHSNAKNVAVQLFKTKGHAVLIVEDDGKGIELNSKEHGIGLRNISSRLDTINGKVNFEPSSESGTLATVRIPV